MEGEVSIVWQDNSVDNLASSVVSAFEAEESGLVYVAAGLAAVEYADRRDQVNASMSSRIREWIRRCVLLCRVPSNR